MVKTFGAPRECGAPGQLPLLPPLSVALTTIILNKTADTHLNI